MLNDAENYEQMRVCKIIKNFWIIDCVFCFKVESELDLLNFDLLCYCSSVVAAANHAQRRADADDDENINLLTPDKSRVAQRAAKRQRQAAAENISAPLSQIDEHE
jgi:hypothetical protein